MPAALSNLSVYSHSAVTFSLESCSVSWWMCRVQLNKHFVDELCFVNMKLPMFNLDQPSENDFHTIDIDD